MQCYFLWFSFFNLQLLLEFASLKYLNCGSVEVSLLDHPGHLPKLPARFPGSWLVNEHPVAEVVGVEEESGAPHAHTLQDNLPAVEGGVDGVGVDHDGLGLDHSPVDALRQLFFQRQYKLNLVKMKLAKCQYRAIPVHHLPWKYHGNSGHFDAHSPF